MTRPIDLILSVMPELAPAYEVGDHRRAAARLARDVELADESPTQTLDRLERLWKMNDSELHAAYEADAEERMYRAGIASGQIKGVK